MRKRCVRGALIAASAVVLGGCAGQDAAAPIAPWPQASYVGGASCASCHVEQAAAWQGSHHDLAMAAATEESVRGDFADATVVVDGQPTRFFRAQDDGFRVETAGPTGAREAFEVAYTFGAEPLQQYLVSFPGGRLQALGIAWDDRPRSEGGQRWFDLYPDEEIPPGDPLHWTGINQNWNFMCASCHSTGLRKGYLEAEDRYETHWEEVDVSCEACHGAGSNHLTWAEAQESGEALPADDTRGLLVDLSAGAGRWSRTAEAVTAARTQAANRQQVETCGACHARRTPLIDGQDPTSELSDSHRVALLDERLYHADGQVRDEVYVYGSFLQSRMYGAGVTCGDCHDPHSGELAAPGNALCSTCHLAEAFDTPEHHRHAADGEGASCVACHMPANEFMVIDERRDHSFRVPRPDLGARIGAPDTCTSCHTEQSQAWAAERIADWRGDRTPRAHFGDALAAGRAGDSGAGEQLVRLADDWNQPGIARATALSLLDRYPSPAALEAVRRGTRNDDPLMRAGALMALQSADAALRLEVALPLLRDRNRSVRLQAARNLAGLPLERLDPMQRERILVAVDELIDALRVNADRPESQMNLGVLLAQTGRAAEAEAAYRAALRTSPEAIEPRVNLADLYRGQGRDAEGELLLREAVSLRPASADVHHALGLLLVRRGRNDEAALALEQAWRLAPERPRLALTFAMALQARGDIAGAIEVLRQAAARGDDPEILNALVAVNRDAGDLEQALEYARRLQQLVPQDVGVRQLVREIERERRGNG